MEYTDFLQLVLSRQSDRAYDKERSVEAEKLGRILEAGRLAPSACNAQPWKFVVITDRELALKVGKAAAGLGMNKFAKDAPVHILIVEESANITSLLGGKVKDKHFPLIDIGIAAAHITLAAESEGLGSCILGWFDEKEIKRLTGIPASKRLLLDIAIGYPVKEKRKKMRKPQEKGSIITGFEGSSISGMSSLQEQLQYYKAGEEVTLTVQIPDKNGEYTEKDIKVTLGKNS